MLSRLAGSVFRVGSAVERTDVVARLLDVYLVRGDPEPDATNALRVVVGAAPTDPPGDRTATLDALALDRHEPASIAHAVAVARDDARRAREVVSTELWDCLDVTRSRMPRKVAVDRAHEFLGWARERSALAIGVVEGDVSRDEVWEFFSLGRALARCTVTARLLASDLVETASAASWSTALRACGVGEASRRGLDHAPDSAEAAAFLLLDEHSPRSLRFVARRADACLTDVGPSCIGDEVAAFRAALDRLEAVGAAEAAVLAAAVAVPLATAAERVVAALDARVFAAPAPAA